MNPESHSKPVSSPAEHDPLCRAIGALVPAMQARAATLDEGRLYPAEDVAALHACGAMLAPFPVVAGGQGVGTTQAASGTVCTVLRLLGRGNMAVGRLYEGHVNSIRLLVRYGSPEQVARAVADVRAGQLLGLWVTDARDEPLTASEDGRLSGCKAFCSGAGHAGHAVVTVRTLSGQSQLAYVSASDAVVIPLDGRLHGMRAASTAKVVFEGDIGASDWVGAPGDYLREPDFSAGAWRTSAVTCGGLESLVDHAMQHLVRRARAGDPHQQARMGLAWIARETAGMWLSRAACAAETDGGRTVADRVATVNFARIAIEGACLDAMRLVERSLGLSAFLDAEPIERIRRDLGTYLRQPAPDEVLTEAAAHVLGRAACGGTGAG